MIDTRFGGRETGMLQENQEFPRATIIITSTSQQINLRTQRYNDTDREL